MSTDPRPADEPVMAYGDTPEEALRNAEKIAAEQRGEPHNAAERTPSLPGRDELAERCRRAWFYSDAPYPFGKERWKAVADAVLAALDTPAGASTDVAVDPEVRLIATCLDTFHGVDAEVVRRVCGYVQTRLAPYPPYPQAF